MADLFQSLNISAADTVSVATFRAMHKNGLRRGPLPSFRKTPPFSQSKSESIKSSGDIKASMTSSAVETFGFDTCDLEEGFEVGSQNNGFGFVYGWVYNLSSFIHREQAFQGTRV